MRVLIVGAGPTGLTAAVELARQGLIPTIIDQRSNLSSLSRAVGILPKTIQILKKSGVSQTLLSKGIQIKKFWIYDQDRKTASISLNSKNNESGYLIGLPQDRTEAALRDNLLNFGVKVKYGTKLENLYQESDKIIVSLQSGAEIPFDLIIGADGIKSKTRECIGVEYCGFDLQETWSIADIISLTWQHATDFTLCTSHDGTVAVVIPLEKNRYRVISNTENAIEALAIPIEVHELLDEGQFQISIRQAKDYCQGRVYLAGDAAHCQSPVGGRGMNLGIADAAILANRIINGNLESYEKTRQIEGKRNILQSERLRKVFTTKNCFAYHLRTKFLKMVHSQPRLQSQIAKRFLDI